MSLFGQTKRHTPPFTPSKGRRSPLPIFNGADEKRFHPAGPSTAISAFFTVVSVPVPHIPLPPFPPFTSASSSRGAYNNGSPAGLHPPSRAYDSRESKKSRRYIRLYLPIPPRLYARIPKPQRPLHTVLAVLLVVGVIFVLLGFRRRPGGGGTWSPPFSEPDSLVLTHEEVAAIWEWEVLSGHHPSIQQPPDNLPILASLRNPAVPSTLLPPPESASPLLAHHQRTAQAPLGRLTGSGPDRHFVNPWEGQEPVTAGFPARPVPGGVLDLDEVLERCDFGTYKYVRDCLEFLRIGGGLDNLRRVRRGNYLSTYRQIYYESALTESPQSWTPRLSAPQARSAALSRAPLSSLPPPLPFRTAIDPASPCDPDRPRVFHMFWAGPFNDKPYMAVMSFLFTQNLGLDRKMGDGNDIIRNSCRPQFWVWINPGPAAAVPNPSAKREMYEMLATNPWSAPFLHERFREVVKFRMWNTTEQLDGVAELRPYWRDMPIFNSGGQTYGHAAAAAAQPTPAAAGDDLPKMGDVIENVETTEVPQPKKKKDALFEKVGSTSESDYDRLSVILSDMARFVLTHRYGGIYLDADTIFLRDWEELWNYRGQFAYRWSWHQKYNTAVMKLHKGSALGTFLFKTALENGLDFHPMTVSKYLKDAGLDKLLFRIPDALFDPAWLNMERYQRERPPFPYFPEMETGGPQPLGFEGFFRGAFSYHFHNFWWLPFDKSRNFPDLGQRFIKGEKALRDAQRIASRLSAGGEAVKTVDAATATESTEGVSARDDMDDEVDLSWSAVVKRTFEAFLRQERPNMYGEWISWDVAGQSTKPPAERDAGEEKVREKAREKGKRDLAEDGVVKPVERDGDLRKQREKRDQGS